MRYQTPQFIEEDEKLFGQLTFRQFVYLIGGFGISFVVYKFFPIIVSILIIVPVIMLSLSLAFYRVNERPFIDTLEAAFYFIVSNRLYTYKKTDKPVKQQAVLEKEDRTVVKTKMTNSKLKDLAWSLDINEKLNRNSGDNSKINI